MRWLKNLFKKTKVRQTLKFDDVESFLAAQTKEKKLELESKVATFRERFINLLEELNNDFKELETSRFNRIILEDKRDISNIVETSRRNYCSNSEKLFVKTLKLLKRKCSASEINSVISEIFDKLNKFSRDAQILLIPFQKQMKKISSDLKTLKTTLEEYQSFLDNEYSIVQLEKKIKELLKKIKESKLNKEQIENKKKELDRKIKNLNKELERCKFKISEIQNSPEALELKKLEKQQILFDRQMENIIAKINNSVNSVSRQIRKYLYIANKKEKSKIKNFLENPENLLKEEPDFFGKVIDNVKNNIKKIEEDEKKIKKFLEMDIVNSLNKYIAEYKKISDNSNENIRKIKKLRQKLSTEKEEMEIAKLNEQIQQMEEDKRKLNIGEVDETELLKDLEKILSDISGKEIKLI
ncbi:MAG: hypothetical protein J7J15_02535 [Candidatus Aenigmarchaeota archaeon]|nr:hypothetical protein [Candidatus Aenigmarchaeota archaeon]